MSLLKFTKEEWPIRSLRRGITQEDVSHIQSRVDLFHCTGKIKKRPGGVPQCRHCLARWIRDLAAQHDANSVLVAPTAQAADGGVTGLDKVLETARVAQHLRADVIAEIADLGAAHVRELASSDWEGLSSWRRLREMERRRILSACGF